MHKFPRRTDKLRILISNDDGVRAPGIKVLHRIARTLSDDVWICAPLNEQSGTGHSLTLRLPIWLRRLSTRRYAVEGTPTDSVLVGIHHALKDRKPDLVLSGVNRGSNMGEFITYSGTCAVAMEATIQGVPAIALSQQTDFDRSFTHWSTVEQHAPDIISKLLKAGWPERTFININFPDCLPEDVAGVEVTEQGSRPIGDSLVESRHPRGGRYFWVGSLPAHTKGKKGTDFSAIEEKRISVTPINLNLTNKRAMKALANALNGAEARSGQCK